MSIEQTDVVDYIGINNATGEVTLVISDHLDWSDVHGHLLLLQEKVNSYLRFVESGEIDEMNLQKGRPGYIIEIVGRYDLVKAAEDFLRQADVVVSGSGFSVRFRKLQRSE